MKQNSNSILMIFLLSLAAFVTLGPLGIHAQSQAKDAKPLIGMWRLVSIVDMKGEKRPNPTGFIVYDASGNMSVQIMPGTPRQKYAGAQPTPDEAKAALNGYVAYFGTYTVDKKSGTVTHNLKGSINPGDIGVDRVRRYEFGPNGRVTLTTLPLTETSWRLVWERVK
jgi:Lipocalin-like domain